MFERLPPEVRPLGFTLFLRYAQTHTESVASVRFEPSSTTIAFPLPTGRGTYALCVRDRHIQGMWLPINEHTQVERELHITDPSFDWASASASAHVHVKNPDRAVFTLYNVSLSQGVCVGASTADLVLASSDNVHVGASSRLGRSRGARNVFVGAEAGANTRTGDNNVYVGFGTGRGNDGGSNNIWIGYGEEQQNVNVSNTVRIGHLLHAEDHKDHEDQVPSTTTTKATLRSDLHVTGDLLAPRLSDGVVSIANGTISVQPESKSSLLVASDLTVQGDTLIDANLSANTVHAHSRLLTGNIVGVGKASSPLSQGSNTDVDLYIHGNVEVSGNLHVTETLSAPRFTDGFLSVLKGDVTDTNSVSFVDHSHPHPHPHSHLRGQLFVFDGSLRYRYGDETFIIQTTKLQPHGNVSANVSANVS